MTKSKVASLLSLLFMAALLLSFVGCGAEGTEESKAKTESIQQSGVSPTGASTAGEITVTDILGREVTIKQPVERVILTFNFEEYFAVTGEEGVSKVVGWSRKYWEGRRQSTWDVFAETFPEIDKIPDVGYVPKSTFNVEAAIALKPDVIFMAKNDYSSVTTDLQRLDAAKIPVVFVDYHEQTMENHCNSTMLFGKIMGKEEQAQKLVDFYQEQTKLVTDRLEKAGAMARPKVYMEFSEAAGPGTFGSSFGKQMYGAIIEQCGGDNISRDLVQGASAPISPEQILAANPDIIIFTGNQFPESTVNVGLGYTSDLALAEKNLATYGEQRKGWSELKAVKDKQVYAMYHDLSRHIFDVAGLQFLAKTIHPELFEDLDPDQTLREFHEKFYPVNYKGAWFANVQ